MKRDLLLLWLILTLGLAACQSGPDLPELPPEVVISQTAERLQSLPGFHFIIERDGDPAFIDPAQTLAFRRAEGDFVAPDKSRASVRIIAPGLVVDVNAISVGATQWETDIATGRWHQLPPDWGFNPAILFDAEAGLPAILANDLREPSLLPPEKLKDGPDEWLYVARGTVDGRRLHTISHGLIVAQEMEMTLWIHPQTFDLYQATLYLSHSDQATATNWLVQLSQFGQVISIEPPQP